MSFVLHHADCLEKLRAMPSKSVDLVITSPPYNKGESANFPKNGRWKLCKLRNGYAGYDDNLPHTQYVQWQRQVLAECWRIVSDKGAIFYNHKPKPFKGELRNPLELNPGLPLRQIIIWHTKSRVNYSHSHFVPTHEWIMVFAKPDFRLKSRSASGETDVWSFMNHTRSNPHPAPFPVELPRRVLKALSPDLHTVLDPFAGSGTTGVAAIESGRDFIGIDREATYIDLAQARLSESLTHYESSAKVHSSASNF